MSSLIKKSLKETADVINDKHNLLSTNYFEANFFGMTAELINLPALFSISESKSFIKDP